MTTGKGGSGPRPDLSGARLGHYELLSRVGAGGMGDVYRARDTRLLREVAVKVLPADVSSDPERLRRFEAEARAASALNHPNIVTVYDVGSSNGVSYIAMELVEGKTLRELLSAGPLPLKPTLEIASRVTDGLARAHEAGVVHRDIKPENVMVTRDGSVKILDFGLAKRARAAFEPGAGDAQTTMSVGTEPGVLLGTVRYMSPEQAAARAVDFRTDQFSFGSVLYEMATGKPAFSGDTSVDTLSAILHAEPEPVTRLNPQVPPPLGWIVERCLAKEPSGRYACTEDLARELGTLREHVSDRSEASPRRRASLGWLVLGVVCAGLIALALFSIRTRPTPPARFRQLTFKNESISTARFAPDGRTIVYASSREGRNSELFSMRTESPGSQTLGLRSSEILAISPAAEMAILMGKKSGLNLVSPHRDSTVRDPLLLYGTVAILPLTGGAPREVLDDCLEADWSPGGEGLAVTHNTLSMNRLEFPPGRVLYQTPSWLRFPRFSPDGKNIALEVVDQLIVVGVDKRVRTLAANASEIVWPRPGNEVWFNRVLRGTTEIHAVRLDGRDRLVASAPGDLILMDVSSDGRVLLARSLETSEILGDFAGENRRDLSWLDHSVAADLSPDGQMLLINEKGEGPKRFSAIYLRRTDGSPAESLGDGIGLAISPDSKFILASQDGGDAPLFLVPTGAGERKQLDLAGMSPGRAGFFPDSRRIFFIGWEQDRGPRVYVMDLAGGKPRPISPEGTHRGLLSGDGRFVTARAKDGQWYLYPTDPEGSPTGVAGLEPGEEPMQWGGGKWLFVLGRDQLPSDGSIFATKVYRLDPWTGQRTLWKKIPPLSPATGGGVSTIFFSADGKVCVYTHHRFSSELYLAEGWK